MIEQVVEDDPAASWIRLGGPQVLPGQDSQAAGQLGEEQKAEHLCGYGPQTQSSPETVTAGQQQDPDQGTGSGPVAELTAGGVPEPLMHARERPGGTGRGQGGGPGQGAGLAGQDLQGLDPGSWTQGVMVMPLGSEYWRW